MSVAAHQLFTLSTADDSDLSDDMSYLDEANEQLDIIGEHVELVHVTKPEIMSLFGSDQVYRDVFTDTRLIWYSLCCLFSLHPPLSFAHFILPSGVQNVFTHKRALPHH